MECVHARASGNRTISEIESNQSGNCVIARVLPMGETAYSGMFLRARTHIGCQRKASSREFPASFAHHPPCPSPPPSLSLSSPSLPPPFSLSLSLYPLLSTTDRLSIRMGNQGFRFAFGACPLTERVSHSIRNNALSTEALFRNDSCHPLYFNRARDYYFSSSKFFLAKFSVSLQFARKLHFPHPKPRNLKKSLSAPRYFISCTVEG